MPWNTWIVNICFLGTLFILACISASSGELSNVRILGSQFITFHQKSGMRPRKFSFQEPSRWQCGSHHNHLGDNCWPYLRVSALVSLEQDPGMHISTKLPGVIHSAHCGTHLNNTVSTVKWQSNRKVCVRKLKLIQKLTQELTSTS